MTDVVMFDEWKWRHAFGIIRAEIGLAYAKLQVLKDEINAARSALRHADVSDEARQECHDVLKAVRMEMGAFSNKLSYLLDEPKGSRAKFASRIVTSRIDEAIDILDDALPDDDADYERMADICSDVSNMTERLRDHAETLRSMEEEKEVEETKEAE